MLQLIFGSLFGGLIVYGGIAELVERVRTQRAGRRAAGVFVGRVDVMGVGGPGVQGRSGRFRFIAENGRTYERTSSFYSFPGPKPGRAVTVIYDPVRPESTAERLGVHRAKLALALPLIGLGMFLIYISWTQG